MRIMRLGIITGIIMFLCVAIIWVGRSSLLLGEVGYSGVGESVAYWVFVTIVVSAVTFFAISVMLFVPSFLQSLVGWVTGRDDEDESCY